MEFITENPTVKRAKEIKTERREAGRADRLREQHDMNVAQTHRSNQRQDNQDALAAEERNQQAAIDAAQRGIATKSGGDAATLAAVPGAGKLAMGLAESEAKAQEDAERLAIQALAAGDMVTFQHWQQKSGLKVPPQALQNAEAGQLFGRAMTAAEAMYKDDPAQAQQFVRAFMQSKGNLEQSIQAVGLPKSKPQYSIETVIDKGQRVLALIDKVSGTAKPVTYGNGMPVMADQTGSNKPTAEERKTNHLIAMGIPAQAAVEIAYGSKTNPQEAEQKLYNTAYEAAVSGFTPKTPEQAHALARQAVENYRSMFGGGFPQITQPPQPQAPQQTQGGFGNTGIAVPGQVQPTGMPQQPALPPVSVPQLQSPMDGGQVLGAVQGLPPDARLYRTDPDGTQWYESQSAGGYIEVPAGAGAGSL